MKPKCTPQQMMRVIRRSINILPEDMPPEQKLILAIISCAITDILDKTLRPSAQAFFKHRLFSKYCDLINLDAPATRGLLREGGFLPLASSRRVC